MNIKQLTKKCSKCGEIKLLSEFYKDKYHKDGRESSCKKCKAKYQYKNKDKITNYQKEYQKENKEKLSNQKKKYCRENKEKIAIRKKIYQQKNKEILSEYQRKYRENNKEKTKKYQEEYRRRHKKYSKEYYNQYYQDHKEQILEHNNQYRINNYEKFRKYYNKWVREKYKTDLKYNLNHKIKAAIAKSLKGNKAGRHWEDLVGYTLEDLIKRLKRTMPPYYCWKDFLEGKLEVDHIIPLSVWNFNNSEQINFKKCWALRNLQLLPAKENLIKSNHLEKPFQLSLAI